MTSHNSSPFLEPLLSSAIKHDDEDDLCSRPSVEDQKKLVKTFTRSAVIFGFILGSFIQFSTLGVNWLVISLFGKDVIISASKAQLFGCSLFWSGLTSAISIWILKFLRDLVNVVLIHGHDHPAGSSFDFAKLEVLIAKMEGHFVGGALAGVCSAWALTDYLLGLRVQMAYSLITLMIASFWSYVLLRSYSFQGAESSNTNIATDRRRQSQMPQVTVV